MRGKQFRRREDGPKGGGGRSVPEIYQGGNARGVNAYMRKASKKKNFKYLCGERLTGVGKKRPSRGGEGKLPKTKTNLFAEAVRRGTRQEDDKELWKRPGGKEAIRLQTKKKNFVSCSEADEHARSPSVEGKLGGEKKGRATVAEKPCAKKKATTPRGFPFRDRIKEQKGTEEKTRRKKRFDDRKRKRDGQGCEENRLGDWWPRGARRKRGLTKGEKKSNSSKSWNWKKNLGTNPSSKGGRTMAD